MASWWETLWMLMFPPAPGFQSPLTVALSQAQGAGPNAPIAQYVRERLDEYEQRSPATDPRSAQPTPQPRTTSTTTTQTAAGDAPTSQAAAQDVVTAIDRVLAARALPGAGTDLYGNVPNGTVYMGSKWTKPSGHPTQRTRSQGGHPSQRRSPAAAMRVDNTTTVLEAIAQVNEWSDAKIERFRDMAVRAGFRDPGTNLDDIERIWSALVVRSAKMYERGIKLTPWQILNRYATGVDKTGAGAGPKTVTSTSTAVDLTEPKTANAIIDAVLTERLGRAATEKEKKAFIEALNEYERKNPKKTKTVTTTSATGETVASTTTSSGGVNASAFAQEWALRHNKDEAAQYQALAMYMPAFFNALSAPV